MSLVPYDFTLGKTAYEKFMALSFAGIPTPKWEDLPRETQIAWAEVAHDIVGNYREEIRKLMV